MYMHGLLIVHGDLKGVGNCLVRPATCDTIVPQGNILINQSGSACLSDFGLSTVVGVDAHMDPLGPKLLDANQTGMTPFRRVRWMSPELLESSGPTKESDVYALGMVIYEVRVRVTVTID